MAVARNIVAALVLSLLVSSGAIGTKPNLRTVLPATTVSGGHSGGYQPEQIRRAYHIDKIIATGKGVLIGIVVAYGSPTIQDDVDAFSHEFGLPTPSLDIAYPQGKPEGTNPRWALETSLDVEWAHAMAPDAKILLVAAKSDSLDDLLEAVDYATERHADVVSMSWGIPEFPDEVDLDVHFDHPGTVYVASSGDFGGRPLWPAASGDVLSVGGTTLPIDSVGNRTDSEAKWASTSHGPSAFEPKPTYQRRFGITSDGHRIVPDVAFVANPAVAVYDTAGYDDLSGWLTSGGTSVGAPGWAGLIALAFEYRLNPTLPSDLYEVAMRFPGGWTQPEGAITLGSSFSMPTGLGTPVTDKLVHGLCRLRLDLFPRIASGLPADPGGRYGQQHYQSEKEVPGEKADFGIRGSSASPGFGFWCKLLAGSRQST